MPSYALSNQEGVMDRSVEDVLIKLEGAFAPNTLKGYGCDFALFSQFCQANGLSAAPASVDTLIAYLEASIGRRKPQTLQRHLAAIDKIHLMLGYPSPAKDNEVSLFMRRMKREHGVQSRQAEGLTREIRERLIAVTEDSLRGARDRALLRLAYESMRRGSELTAFNLDDLHVKSDGTATLYLKRSKTDQEGRGLWIALSTRCVDAIQAWVIHAGITSGPILRGVNLHGHVSTTRLNPNSVSYIYRQLAQKAGLAPAIVRGLTSHSARVGAAQDLLKSGESLPQIMRRGGWKSPAIVMRYTEQTDLQPME
jgi:integrase